MRIFWTYSDSSSFPFTATTLAFGIYQKFVFAGFTLFFTPLLRIAIKLIKLWYENEKRVSDMEKTKLESELKMLKDQVNPHFLFNTLNNLYGLIAKNPVHAQESVLGLSRILHYMLHESNHDRISVLQEIRCIRDYIELEKNPISGQSFDLVECAGKRLKVFPLFHSRFFLLSKTVSNMVPQK